jgi:prolipoprotein diacylglyceryltransferase
VNVPRQLQFLFLAMAGFWLLTVLATNDMVFALRRIAVALLWWLLYCATRVSTENLDDNRYAGG